MNYEKLIEYRKIVAKRIEAEINKNDFELSIAHFVTIHERLFKSLLENYGYIRKYNLEKPEVILAEDSINYPDYHTVPFLLNHAIQE